MIAGVGFILGWISKNIILQRKIIELVRNYSQRIRNQDNEIQRLKYERDLNKMDIKAGQDECNRLRLLLHDNGAEGSTEINPRILTRKETKESKKSDDHNQFSALGNNPGALMHSVSLKMQDASNIRHQASES